MAAPIREEGIFGVDHPRKRPRLYLELFTRKCAKQVRSICPIVPMGDHPASERVGAASSQRSGFREGG